MLLLIAYNKLRLTSSGRKPDSRRPPPPSWGDSFEEVVDNPLPSSASVSATVFGLGFRLALQVEYFAETAGDGGAI